MSGDQERTYRRVLSGPMGVGKSYLSYFLAAKAYAEGWPVLYISDAGLLDKDDENESALVLVKRFLALNKDILTGAELEMLENDYDGTRNISRNALSVIFGTLLMTRDLLHTFLGSTSIFGFDWDLVDLGLVYRSKDASQKGTRHHILCLPAQKALLELFKTLPLPEDTKRRLCDGSLSGEQFETALYHRLICTTKPIVLNATDLNGSNATIVSLDFSHCETLEPARLHLDPATNGSDPRLRRISSV